MTLLRGSAFQHWYRMDIHSWEHFYRAFYRAYGVPFFPLLISQHWVVNLFMSTLYIVEVVVINLSVCFTYMYYVM